MGHCSGSDFDQFEAVVAVGLFVDSFEAKGLFEGDAAGFSVGDEAEVEDEENLLHEDLFALDAIKFCSQGG